MKEAVAVAFAVLTAIAVTACDRIRDDAAASDQPVTASQTASGALAKGSERVRFGTATCDACLARQCNPYQGLIPLWTECADAKCEEAFACYQRNHCATDLDSVNQCYCGKGVSNDDCLADDFNARGPCAALLNAANESDDTRVVFGMMYAADRSVGDGAALFRCGAELCTKECVNDPAIPPLGK